jgi:uncharacterized membrane protein YkvA (DUF1232 family)
MLRSASETLGFIKPELPTLVPEPPTGEGWIRYQHDAYPTLSHMQWIERAKSWAREVKRDVVALYLAARDPRTPLIAKIAAASVAAYALSPIDLIPDFVPVLGYLDDLLIIPLSELMAALAVAKPPLKGLRQGSAQWLRPELRVRVKHLKAKGILRHATVKQFIN